MRRVVAAACLVFAAIASGQVTISQKVAGARALPGFFPVWYGEKDGKLWLEVSRWNTEFLYYPSLPAGVGSNDIGLDRGQLGQERIVRFERHGAKVFLVQPNERFVAGSTNAAEQRSVQDSFASSVLWGFEIAAEEGDRVLVDATPFFLRDAHGVIRRMTDTKQGTFQLDASRSALYQANTRNFPRNTEVEAILTFTSDNPGPLVRSVASDAEAVTVHEHHSFVALPEAGFRPRAFNPNGGFFPGADFVDYSTPLGETMRKRFIARHRLEKRNSTAAVSDPVKPIVYYLDPGVPEPLRGALLEGARWWAQAFEAAGFRNAFQVEMLPEGADPMDIRYNMIQWVHRSTRGWSYGTAVTDPRSGEILKGHVTLGSLRARQDYLIAEALLAPYGTGSAIPKTMEQMVLARLRQLAAHEVGHTLGLAHNYISSTANRASVMDYPHPLALLSSAGAPDLSKAYATGMGDWDKVAITWGYGEGGDHDAVLAKARARGLRFITDADSRPPGSPHALSHLWDNGADPVAELDRVLEVRQRALDRFGETNIRIGTPIGDLEDTLVPLFLLHRYQVEAVSKMIGGLDYSYALRGDGQTPVKVLSAAEQNRALAALLKTLRPEALTLPERVLALLPPKAFPDDRGRENFRGRTGLAFDAVAPAEAAASLTVSLLLHPERAARLADQNFRDRSLPDLNLVIDQLLSATILAAPGPVVNTQNAVKRRVDFVVLYHLMALASEESASPAVRAIAWERLTQVSGASGIEPFVKELIERFRKDPAKIPISAPPELPPGQPI